MTFSVGAIQGGTNAGWRRVKVTAPWRCKCPNPEGHGSRFKLNPAYLRNCLDCKERQP